MTPSHVTSRARSYPASPRRAASRRSAARRFTADATAASATTVNDDTELVDPGWLRELVSWVRQPEIGLVGVQLIDPDGLIQHGGVVVGMSGFGDHLVAGCRPGDDTLIGSTTWYRNSLSVTAACVAVDRSLFERVGDALVDAGFSVTKAPIVSVGKLALGERREQLRSKGALAVDMESAWLAQGASKRPFAVVRVVLDTPEKELLRVQMIPVALRAGAVLRRVARALDRVAGEHGLHRLFAGGAQSSGPERRGDGDE